MVLKNVKSGTAGANEANEDASGLGTVVIRNEFYRDGYRNLLRLCLLEGVIIMILLGAMYSSSMSTSRRTAISPRPRAAV